MGIRSRLLAWAVVVWAGIAVAYSVRAVAPDRAVSHLGIVDCNDNGVDDTADIAGGLSEDCNDNGVPDECDITAGVGQQSDDDIYWDDLIITIDNAPAVPPTYSTTFDDLSVGQTQWHPGAAGHDGWHRGGATNGSYGEIQDTLAVVGRAMHQHTTLENTTGEGAEDRRALAPPDLSDYPIITLEVDFYCTTSDESMINEYQASLEVGGGPHPGFNMIGFRLAAGNNTPKSETGVNVSIWAFNGVDNHFQIPLTVGRQLSWEAWHHLTLVVDQENDTFTSLTVDGQTEDLTMYALPRSFDGSQWLRGQLMEVLTARLVTFDWPDDETADDVYWDNMSLTVSDRVPAEVVYAGGFDDLSTGPTLPHPGDAGQGGWYQDEAHGESYGEILDAVGRPGQVLHERSAATCRSGVATIDARAVASPDMVARPYVSLTADFYCSTSEPSYFNKYTAEFGVAGPLGNDAPISGFGLTGGAFAPKSETGVSLTLDSFNGLDGNLAVPLTVGQGLAWASWHDITLVADQATGSWVSVTVDGQSQSLEGYPLPRVYSAGQWRRPETMEVLHASLTADDLLPPGPPPADLTEMSADRFGSGAAQGTVTVADDLGFAQVGDASIRMEATGGFDTYIRYDGDPSGTWNLSDADFVRVWMFAVNPNLGFQDDTPWLRLGNGDGYYEWRGAGTRLNEAIGQWVEFVIPLSGDASWPRTTNGSPSMTDVSYLEIHADTWGEGFTLWIDGLGFDPNPPATWSIDCNDNGVPDECDLLDGVSQDCQPNGVPDECDIDDGFSADCQSNDIPDECEIADGVVEDCQPNGVPDTCDIADGTSGDCQLNSVPDECEIALGIEQDCQPNGVPDGCDIASGVSVDADEDDIPDECQAVDCNENSVPDHQDIADGTSQDCNANEIPDECDLADGISYDCQPNGLLDECELTGTMDITDRGVIVGKIFSLSPAYPMGGGSHDPEVMRDDDWPALGVWAPERQFDTFHRGDQGDEDWIGYRFDEPTVLRSLTFQQGMVFGDGGWFDELHVQVRVDGLWREVASLASVPPYGSGSGQSFETYAFSFEETVADAIRLYGDPGGSNNFISVGELRVTGEASLGIDCNGNRVPDVCDVAAGTSEDCQPNGVVDECDIESGISVDANDNGIPDECENFLDCNANGIDDASDILNETSEDCQPDGVPDECASGLAYYSVEVGSPTLSLVQFDPRYPMGDVVLGGVPFDIPLDEPNTWFTGAYSGTFCMQTNPAIPGVREVYTLINSRRGQPGPESLAWVEFIGSDGAYYRKDLIGDEDIRCFQDGDYTNQINGTTTVNVVDLDNGRLDLQRIALPEDFHDEILSQVKICDGGLSTTQRIFVAGIAAKGTAWTDCNLNAVPDDCDLSSGTSLDDNENGTLDTCEADLEAITGTLPPTADAGANVEITWTVESSGGYPPASVFWHDQAYLSDDALPGDDVELVSHLERDMLEVPDQYVAVRSAQLPNDAAGAYWVIVDVDATDVVPEWSEDNNQLVLGPIVVNDVRPPETTITVGPADGAHVMSTQVSFEWTGTDNGTPTENLDFAWCLATAGESCDPVGPFSAPTTVVLNGLSEANNPYVFRIAARDSAGLIDASPDERTFWIDFTAPAVVAQTPAGETYAPIEFIDVMFNEPISSGTFTTTDVSLIGPDSEPISLTQPPEQVEPHVWRLHFERQTVEGGYGLTIGPGIEDTVGLPMAMAYESTLLLLLPNLTITDVVTPVEGWTEQPVDVSWTVQNGGAGSATGMWQDCLYLSDDDAVGGDTLLRCVERPVELTMGSDYVRFADVVIPEIEAGDYWIVVHTDATNGLPTETDETDNVAIAGPFPVYITPCPDLVPSGLVIPTAPVGDGDTVFVDWLVTNAGTGATDTPFWYERVYLSTDRVLGPADVAVAPDFANPMVLNPGESYPQNIRFDLPEALLGEYYVIVETDAFDDMSECDEANNVLASDTRLTIEYRVPPTLTMTDCQVTPMAPWPGDPITVSWTVTNTGEEPTGPFEIDHGILLSADDTLHEPPTDTALDWHVAEVTAELDVGETTSVTLEAVVSVPVDVWGDRYIIIWPDPQQNVDLARSPCAVPITVQAGLPADLELTGVTAPATATSGQAIGLTWTVQNSSYEPTNLPTWEDKVVLSVDDSFETTDDNVLVGTYEHSGTLGFEEGYTGPESGQVILPHGVSGSYFVFVQVDSSNRVYEGDWEANNVGRAGPVDVTLLAPDLQVTEVAFLVGGEEVDSVHSGASATVQWQVTNTGGAATTTSIWRDGVYLSFDEVLETTVDSSQGIVPHWVALEPGESYTASEDVSIGIAWSDPDIYYFVCTDEWRSAYESDEGNNCTRSAPIEVIWAPPDLRVQSVVVDAGGAPIEAGSSVDVTWTVINDYLGTTRTNVIQDRIYLSADDVVDASDPWVGTLAHTGRLSAGETYTESMTVEIPEGAGGTAQYFLVKTDYMGSEYERDEDNNVGGAGPFDIAWGLPDLIVSPLWIDNTAEAGTSVELTWWLRNIGGPIDITTWYDRVYLSDDRWLSGDDLAYDAVVHVGALDYWDAYSAHATIDLPPDAADEFYLIFETDTDDVVIEADESNNTNYAAISIYPIVDLQVTEVAAPDTALAGQTMEISWTVSNTGVGPSPSTWRDAVYLSPDPYFDEDTDDYLGFYEHVGTLSPAGMPGDSYARTETVAMPAGLSGPQYLFVATDVSDQVVEENDGGNAESNNVAYDGAAVAVEIPLPVDLMTTSVTMDAEGLLGEQITVDWVVHNDSEADALGRWHDVVYLSSDEHWDIHDKRVGMVQHVGPLIGGGSYAPPETLTAPLPGVVPGLYHVIVRCDIYDEIREDLAGEQNNITVSTELIDVGCWPLPLEFPDSGRLLSTGDAHYFQISDVPAGEDLAVALDGHDDAYLELFVRFGQVPDEGHYDVAFEKRFAADHEIVVPATHAGDYYVLVRGVQVPGEPAPYTIGARLLPFELRRVEPAFGGDVGAVTLRVEGGQLSADTEVRLVGEGDTVLVGSEPNVVDPTKMYVTFDLAGMAIGSYDVVMTKPGETPVTLAGGFEIRPGTGPHVVVRPVAPALMRLGDEGVLWVQYENVGDVDARSPLLVVSVSDEVPMRLPDWGAFESGPVQLLAIGSEGPVATIPPGDRHELPVHFAATEPGTIYFAVAKMLADETAIDWPAVEGAIRPDGVDPDRWDAVFATLRDRLGMTWASYLSVLVENARRLAAIGQRVSDARALFGDEVAEIYAAADGAVVGYVALAETSDPLPGLEVRLETEGGSLAAYTTSDAQGRFVFEFVQNGTYILGFEGHYANDRIRATLDSETEIVEVAALVLPCSTISGRVTVGSDGSPVSDMVVMAVGVGDEATGATTDAGGHYAITDLPAGEYVVQTCAAAYTAAAVSDPVSTLPGEVRDGIDLVLSSGGRIAGNVRSQPDSEGVPGVLVVATDEDDGQLIATTDDDGAYEIDGVPAGTWRVTVWSVDHLATDIQTLSVVHGSTTALDFILDPGGRIQGVVSATGGEHIVGATLAASNGEGGYALARTDAEGVYTLSPLGEGVYRVSVSTPVHAPDAVMGIEIAGDQTVSGLDFALEPGRLLEGTVTHVDGAVPIPDALVVLMPAEFAPHSARTDIAGAFAFRSLAAGTYHMTVMAPGVCTHQQMVTIPESGPTPSVNVALTHGSKVHGHVWLPDGASPLSEVYVVLLGSDGAQVGGAKSGTSGFYEIASVPPGSYEIKVWSPSMGFEAAAIEVIEGQDTTHDFTAFGGGMYGTVASLASGLPVAGADVVLVRPGTGAPATRAWPTVTDLNGQFAFPFLAGETYLLIVEAPDMAREERFVAVTADEAVQADVALATSRSVTGTVRDVDTTTPVVGARILAQTLTGLYDDPGIATTTDESGTFTLAGVSPGAYRLHCLAEGYALTEEIVVVSASGAQVDLEASSDGVLLSVAVLEDGTDLPVPSATVLLTTNGLPVGVAVTDAAGTAQFAPVADGDYEVVVTGRQARDVQTAAVAGTPVDLTMRLSLSNVPGLPAQSLIYEGWDWSTQTYTFDCSTFDDFWDPAWADPHFPPMPACDSAVGLQGERAWLVEEMSDEILPELARICGLRGKWLYLQDELTTDCTYINQAMPTFAKEVKNLGIDVVITVSPAGFVKYGVQGGKAVLDVGMSAYNVIFGGATLWDATPVATFANTMTELRGVKPIPLLDIVFDGVHTYRASIGILEAMQRHKSSSDHEEAAYDEYFLSLNAFHTENRSFIERLEEYDAVAGKDCCALCVEASSDLGDFDCGTCEPDPPTPPTGEEETTESSVPASYDPNEKHGPAGYGERQFVSGDMHVPYVIYFENLPEASAPAQMVIITDQLSTDLDWRTFQLGEIAFGDTVVEVPPRKAHYVHEVAIGDDLLIRIDAGLNILSGVATWTLTAIDPETGERPANPLVGLLPPNDPEVHNGEGHVEFSVRPRDDVPTGREITNEATIIFDVNEPIDTNEVFSTVDAVAPQTAVDPLPGESSVAWIDVSWAGQDDADGAGLNRYQVYVRTDDGPAELWYEGIATEAVFLASAGHTYGFHSLGIDNAGNVEAAPLVPDTTISVTGSGPLGDIDLDGDSDLDDFRLLADECFQGPSMGILVEPAHCLRADMTGDGRVDLADYAAFQVSFGVP